MKFIKLSSSFLFKIVFISLGLLMTPSMATQGSNVTFVPPDGDQPKDSQGGASRDGGKCREDDQSLTPYLTPVIPRNAQRFTLEPRPTIFVYVPQTTASKAFVSLQNQQNQDHYQTFFPLEKTGGIVKIELPSDAPTLIVDTDYQWSFVLLCEDKLLPDSPTVTGTIRRVNRPQHSPTQPHPLINKPSLEKAAMLGKAGIWYDMLKILADLKAENSNNFELNQIWSEMLNAADLEAIATQPIIINQ